MDEANAQDTGEDAAAHARAGEVLPRLPQADGAMPSTLLLDLAEDARAFAAAATAPATRRAYASDWRVFTAWCTQHGVVALPTTPAVVALFLTAQAKAGRRPSTLERRLAAIGYRHREAGLPPPTAMVGAMAIEQVMRGIRTTLGTTPVRKRAATADVLRTLLATITGDALRDRRDRALLAFGFASAMRRSELSALRVEHLDWGHDGVRVHIPRSKGDQEGRGRTIAVPRGLRVRPVLALEVWMGAAGITEGFVFRRVAKGGRVLAAGLSGDAIAQIVKARAAAAELDPAVFAAHSLRSGFLTSAAEHRASLFKMRDQSGHKSLDVLEGYVQAADLFQDHAGAGFL